MNKHENLFIEVMLVLQALGFQPPPTLKVGKTDNAMDMIDYMNRVEAEMKLTGTNLLKKFKGVVVPLHSGTPLLETSITGIRPKSTTDPDANIIKRYQRRERAGRA